MVGTALARMAAATPIVSACFDADARVLKPVIGWFSCSLFARLEVPSAAAGCNGPKLGRLDWLAEVQAALSLELHRNSGCRPCAADNGHRLDDGRNGEWRPVTAPAASLGLGTLRPDSLSSAANTVGVGIRRAVHPCLLRLRLSVHGAAWALATNASEVPAITSAATRVFVELANMIKFPFAATTAGSSRRLLLGIWCTPGRSNVKQLTQGKILEGGRKYLPSYEMRCSFDV